MTARVFVQLGKEASTAVHVFRAQTESVSCATWEEVKAASLENHLSVPQCGKLQLCTTTGQQWMDEMEESIPL